MARLDRIRDRLPSLYRPEPGEPGLVPELLRAVAELLDRVEAESVQVMQAHWLAFADRGQFSPYLARLRETRGEPPPRAGDPDVALFPYLDDLSRLGSLLALLPWREPAASRELVEAYRRRIRRVVALYRGGPGTAAALRAMVEASLPVDLTRPPGLQDRPFTLDELAGAGTETLAVTARGAPETMVGPLMRWTVQNPGLRPSAPTLYVQGVAPVPDRVDATERPLVELYAGPGGRERIGIAYGGTLASGETLRLRPAYRSWLGAAGGVQVAASVPAGAIPADPTAPGPWAAAPGAPAEDTVALVQAQDRSLYALTRIGGESRLHRFDGAAWSQVLAGLPPVAAMIEDGGELLLGTDAGTTRLQLYPDPGPAAPDPDPAGLAGPAVLALYRAGNGQLWAGTATGLARIEAGDALVPFGLGEAPETETAVHAIAEDATGTLYLGTELGLFQYQPGFDAWYWYEGRESSDRIPDWQPFRPGAAGADRNLPESSRVFLPPVRCVHRSHDSSLWIGTERGIARYIAHPVRGLSYTTLLEAFPDLAAGLVHAIREDERGGLWFATEQGLFRFDGRDWWQAQGGALARLAAGTATRPGRLWRFNRGTDQWELRDPATPAWVPFAGGPRGMVEAPVLDILWTDQAVADLGSFDGASFTPDEALVPAPLAMRYKPAEDRIVDGGIPAVPRLPAGASEWRYLAVEPAAVPAPASLPAWTIEGRLLPPPELAEAAEEGRYGPPPLSDYDEAVFAFNPAARVWLAWEPARPFAVVARLARLDPAETIAPAILDRVQRGLDQVRPAGVAARLAVEQEIVRGS